MEYKVLIADDCFGSVEDAERTVTGYGMRAFFCERDGDELIRRIDELKPDAVVMNVAMRGTDGFGVLARMNGDARAPKFILTHLGGSTAKVMEAMELGASYCIELPIDRHLLADRLDMLRYRAECASVSAAAKPKRDTEAVIADVLHELAVPAHIKGYQYLREAVSLSLRSAAPVSFVTKEIYPAVARRFGTTVSCVERAIRHAIELTWDRGDVDVLNGFFGYTVRADRGKPTNSEFIAIVAEKLRTDVM
ncbi:MAG: sporulation transcription factor Spo0A [Clostridia bacterium]|nr:sporulation transcription factor Spo0A [Clostridia bacterium]